MIRMKSLSVLLASALAFGSLGSSAAFGADLQPSYQTHSPAMACAKSSYIKQIQSRFVTQARNVHHRPDWRVADIDHIHEHRYLPRGYDGDNPIARRYCHGTALFNDGQHRKIWYLIEEHMGFAGAFGSNVEFCIDGLDDWNVYNANCRVLR